MISKMLAGLLIVVGGIFSLQGAGILLGSVMTGDSFWLYVGIAMIIAGVGLLVYQNRKKPDVGES